MGTRYHLTLDCPHCGESNEDVYFAPTCEIGSHWCVECRERFWIGDDLAGHKEPVQVDMRKHSTWGEDWTEKTGAAALQFLD